MVEVVFVVSKNAREMKSEIPGSIVKKSFNRCLKNLKIHRLFVTVAFDPLYYFLIKTYL